MPERLWPADIAFLRQESVRTPQHIGNIAIFDPSPDGLDYTRLRRLVEERLALVPRLRQKVRAVPARLADPVWVDDAHFDISYHLRRSALPRPGEQDVLLDFCARVLARPLDRDRPLWELYLIEGLSHGRVAILSKTHLALTGGGHPSQLGQVLLDDSAEPWRMLTPAWTPQPEPSGLALVGGAARELLAGPRGLAGAARRGVREVWTAGAWVCSHGGGLLRGTGLCATNPVTRRQAPSSLRAGPSGQRRLALARTDLADYRYIAARAGTTVLGAVLAVVTAALRGWLLSRDEQLPADRTVRALVLASVPELEGQGSAGRAGVECAPSTEDGPATDATVLVDLPVGEPDPLRRLARLREAMSTPPSSQYPGAADVLATLRGFAAPIPQALVERIGGSLAPRLADVLIAYAPVADVPGAGVSGAQVSGAQVPGAHVSGAQQPRYVASARMLASFPIPPLTSGHAVSLGLTCYDGSIFFGINADRDRINADRDRVGGIDGIGGVGVGIGALADLIERSLADLRVTADALQLPALRACTQAKPTSAKPTRLSTRGRPKTAEE